jgi:hypothetical protein
MVENYTGQRSPADVRLLIERFAIGVSMEGRNSSSDWIESIGEKSVN